MEEKLTKIMEITKEEGKVMEVELVLYRCQELISIINNTAI